MKKIAIIITAVVLAAVCAAVIYATRPEIKAAADSQILCNDRYVYFNDIKGRLCRAEISGGRPEAIAKDARLISAYGDKVLAEVDSEMQILDWDGVLYARLPEMNYPVARITGDNLYYLNTDGRVWRADIYGGGGEPVLEAPVKDFIIYGRMIIYTPDGNSLLVYSMDTKSTGRVLEGVPISDFAADDDYLFVTNGNNGNTLLKINSDASRIEELLQIKTKTFTYKNGRLFYIENADSDKKEYKLITDPIMVHGK